MNGGNQMKLTTEVNPATQLANICVFEKITISNRYGNSSMEFDFFDQHDMNKASKAFAGTRSVNPVVLFIDSFPWCLAFRKESGACKRA
jgi:hypothetical protein